MQNSQGNFVVNWTGHQTSMALLKNYKFSPVWDLWGNLPPGIYSSTLSLIATVQFLNINNSSE